VIGSLSESLPSIVRVPEARLKFRTGHEPILDPKYGLMDYHPFDWNSGSRKFDRIRLGVACLENHERGILEFIANSEKEILPRWKQNRVKYVPFRMSFQCDLGYSMAEVEHASFALSGDVFSDYELIERGYRRAIRALRGKADVVLVEIPPELEPYKESMGRDLHSIVKKIGVQERVLTQILTPHSLNNLSQDLSDTMWNLSVAIYAKAGGVPWTLEDLLPVSSVFVGIAFCVKKTGKDQFVLSGVAQLYNSYGIQVESVVIDCTQLGTDFLIDRDLVDDMRSYHLSEEKAQSLITSCLTKYRSRYGRGPKNIVVHKTTYFKDEEKRGIKKAAPDSEIDFIHLVSHSKHQLFREKDDPKGGYPVNQGSFLQLDSSRAILYTAGLIDSLGTYPGAGSPVPIELRSYGGVTPLVKIAEQTSALAKMDWNTCKLIVQEPVDLIYARRVGDVLKEGLGSSEVIDEARYFM